MADVIPLKTRGFLIDAARESWMAGTSPAMTELWSAVREPQPDNRGTSLAMTL
jgi:hypothetical protein